MSEPVSALAGAVAEGCTIGIEDTGPRGQITLRGDLGSEALAGAVREVAGAAVPGTWRVEGAGSAGAVSMSPDELLLLVPHGAADERAGQVARLLAGEHHMAVNVSDARAILRLTGPRVGEVLAKGVPCDVTDRGFPPGSARRTHLGQVAVVLWRLDAETWEIGCFRSFAHHLMAWLEAAAVPGSEVG